MAPNNENIIEKLYKIFKIKRKAKDLISVDSSKDVWYVSSGIADIVNSHPKLALLFTYDPEQFCSDFGINLGAEVLRHIRETEFFKNRETEIYKKLLKDEITLDNIGIKDIKLSPKPPNGKTSPLTPQLLKLFKEAKKFYLEKGKDYSAENWKEIIDKAKKVVQKQNSDRFYLLSRNSVFTRHTQKAAEKEPFAPASEQKKGEQEIEASTQKTFQINIDDIIENYIQNPATAGWDVVLQVKSDFMDKFIDKIFTFSLFGSLIVGDLIPYEYEFKSWLLTYFKMKLEIHRNPYIYYPTLGLASLKKVRFVWPKVKCTVCTRAYEDDAWSEPQVIYCSIVQEAPIEPRENGVFLGSSLNNYHVIDFSDYESELSVGLQTEMDAAAAVIVQLWIIGTFNSYIDINLPEFPITPELDNVRPFMFFDKSEASICHFHAFGFAKYAITTCWGDTPPGVSPFPHWLCRSDSNIVFGLSSAVFHYMIRRHIPNLPIRDGDVVVKTVDIELRNGYIEISGKGTKEGDCFDTDFTFLIKVKLKIDNDGTLKTAIIDVSVALPGWFQVVFNIILPYLGYIIVAILEGIAGEEAEEAVNKSLNIIENIEEKYLNIPSVLPITVDLHSDVQISQNGVFFHGNIDLEE